jgi:PTH1 family peptidyl-tRNA hydrolase
VKYLIAGLGNIGAEYAGTRHNIGFDVLEEMTRSSGTSFRSDRYADVAELRAKGRHFILIKPTTFMNLSGKAVRYWLDQENITIDRLLVVTDDLALPFGKIRIRAKGSDGGHNGLKNIAELLRSETYARLRFGIAGNFQRGAQVDYVLGKWTDEERTILPDRLQKAASACISFGLAGIQTTMNQFNNQ